MAEAALHTPEAGFGPKNALPFRNPAGHNALPQLTAQQRDHSILRTLEGCMILRTFFSRLNETYQTTEATG
jgi:hypothetical protein